MSEKFGSVKVGDRVRIDRSGEQGIVRVVYAGLQEDRLTVELESGRLAGLDERHVTTLVPRAGDG